MTMSDFGGPGDDSEKEDFSEKMADEERESSSEEVEVMSFKRKTSLVVNQHVPSASTYKSPAKPT